MEVESLLALMVLQNINCLVPWELGRKKSQQNLSTCDRGSYLISARALGVVILEESNRKSSHHRSGKRIREPGGYQGQKCVAKPLRGLRREPANEPSGPELDHTFKVDGGGSTKLKDKTLYRTCVHSAAADICVRTNSVARRPWFRTGV